MADETFLNAVDSRDAEAVTWDNSEELRQANSLALEERTRAEGIGKLKEIIGRFPDSADPYGLLAQALTKSGRAGEAEQALREAFPKVLKKSKVAGDLALISCSRTRTWRRRSNGTPGAWRPPGPSLRTGARICIFRGSTDPTVSGTSLRS